MKKKNKENQRRITLFAEANQSKLRYIFSQSERENAFAWPRIHERRPKEI